VAVVCEALAGADASVSCCVNQQFFCFYAKMALLIFGRCGYAGTTGAALRSLAIKRHAVYSIKQQSQLMEELNARLHAFVNCQVAGTLHR
jgi:hypothetical protein